MSNIITVLQQGKNMLLKEQMLGDHSVSLWQFKWPMKGCTNRLEASRQTSLLSTHTVLTTLFGRPRETRNCWGPGNEPSVDSQQPAVGQAQEPAEALGGWGEPEPHSPTQLLTAYITVWYFVPVVRSCFFFPWRVLQIRKIDTLHLHQNRELGFPHNRDTTQRTVHWLLTK